MYVFVCNLKSTCMTGDAIMIVLENGLERKKIMFHIVVLKGVGCYM